MSRGAERRTAQREKRERAQRTRRLFLIGGSAAVVLGGGAVAARALGLPPFRDQSIGNDQLFEVEYSNLGIKKSSQEEALVTSVAESRSNPPKPDTHENRSLAANKLSRTMSFMERSANPVFNDAAGFLKGLRDSGKLSLAIRPAEGSSNGLVRQMTSLLTTDSGRPVWEIQATSTEVLNLMDTVEVAIAISHEAEHLKNMTEIVAQNPILNPQQQIDLLQGKIRDKQYFVEEEARGYAVQARAYIYEAGLLGRRDKKSESEGFAVAFIKAGNNPSSPDWISYVAKHLNK